QRRVLLARGAVEQGARRLPSSVRLPRGGAGEPRARRAARRLMAQGDTVSILDGNTFVVSDRRGDIDASPDEPHGLFHQDTRFLSRWRLTVGGRSPRLLSTDDVDYFAAQFFLVPPEGSVYQDAAFSIVRRRSVGDGFREDVTVKNHTADVLELELRVDAAA